MSQERQERAYRMGADVLPRQPEPERPDWEDDLARVGIVRRMLAARRWFGIDWWFVAVSSVMVVIFLVLALFPQVFAPFDPRAQVGPRLLAPGDHPNVQVIVGMAEDGVRELIDLAGDRVPVGVVQGEPSSGVVRDEARELTDELQAQGQDVRIRLRINRFESLELAFQALVEGEVLAVVAASDPIEEVIGQYPELAIGSPVRDEDVATRGFTLGTNQLGQDVLSRLIWGTRYAFLIGFSASLFALVLGVPLGLLAGYAGGKTDRLMSLVMDSVYAFPGLILAIAITAVLGPSVFNVIVAIAVVYIPTYFRIVRGQTLSVKEEIYVEAARSIGARKLEVLRRYIFPNVIPSVAIIFSVNVADAILTGAGLSFLGLGLPPTTPDWGIDLAAGQERIQAAWWLITFPGVAVMLVVLAFTMMGEGLMEMFNPKLRER